MPWGKLRGSAFTQPNSAPTHFGAAPVPPARKRLFTAATALTHFCGGLISILPPRLPEPPRFFGLSRRAIATPIGSFLLPPLPAGCPPPASAASGSNSSSPASASVAAHTGIRPGPPEPPKSECRLAPPSPMDEASAPEHCSKFCSWDESGRGELDRGAPPSPASPLPLPPPASCASRSAPWLRLAPRPLRAELPVGRLAASTGCPIAPSRALSREAAPLAPPLGNPAMASSPLSERPPKPPPPPPPEKDMLTLGSRARKPSCQSSCSFGAAPCCCCCSCIPCLGGPGPPRGTPRSSRRTDGAPASSASSPSSSMAKKRAKRERFGGSSDTSSSSPSPDKRASNPEPSRIGSRSAPRLSGGPRSAPSEASALEAPVTPVTPPMPSDATALLPSRALGPLVVVSAAPPPMVPSMGDASPAPVAQLLLPFPTTPGGVGAARSLGIAARSRCWPTAREPTEREPGVPVSRAAAAPTGPTGPPTATRDPPTGTGGSSRAKAASRDAASRTEAAAVATAAACAVVTSRGSSESEETLGMSEPAG
mmetsp:Transcript_1152/g.3622  ORF Transcript_1152/g.3622 Transcript_1152/m.3622 type:complete len:539 (-) Transcript_1152:949-2565(-)|eukprot:scaffold24093_cov105-Isochrysis_galbana.AAC.3